MLGILRNLACLRHSPPELRKLTREMPLTANGRAGETGLGLGPDWVARRSDKTAIFDGDRGPLSRVDERTKDVWEVGP